MYRVLNSFLQFIEHNDSHSLIVAATNHPELLDHAVYRRFDDVVEYDLPTPSQVADTLMGRVRDFAGPDVDWSTLGASASGLSYAKITRAADEAMKDAIIGDRTAVSQAELQLALAERLAMRPGGRRAPAAARRRQFHSVAGS